MTKKYHPATKFFTDEDDAKRFCSAQNASGNNYKKKTYKAFYMTYTYKDGPSGFLCWYYY